jgi:acetyl esterase/lipase
MSARWPNFVATVQLASAIIFPNRSKTLRQRATTMTVETNQKPRGIIPRLLTVIVAPQFMFFAWRRRTLLVTGACGVAMVVTAILGLWPTISDWHRARQHNVAIPTSSVIVPPGSRGDRHSDKTVTYADGSRLDLDVWLAQGVSKDKLRPAIVTVHGGVWTHESRGQAAKWNKWFNNLGYDVFDIDYRMPPPLRRLDEVGKVKCAIGWIAANAPKYHVDSRRISMIGYSDGENLVLLTSYSMGDPRLPPACRAAEIKIRSVIDFYDPADGTLLYSNTGSYAWPMMDNYICGSSSAFLDRYKTLSPISHINAQTPPTLTLQGEADRDVPGEQTMVLDQALTVGGVYHETFLFPWAGHGFDRNWSSIAAQIARAKIKDFLQKHG